MLVRERFTLESDRLTVLFDRASFVPIVVLQGLPNVPASHLTSLDSDIIRR